MTTNNGFKLAFAIAFAGAVIIATCGKAHAQTIADLQHSIQLLTTEVDRLQVAQNAKIGPQNVAAYIDAVYSAPNGIMVEGWALECGQRRPLVSVLVDGVLTTEVAVTPIVRGDVNSAFAAYCAPLGGLLPDLGAAFMLDLSHWGAGPHTITMRVRSVLTGYVTESNTVTVNQ